MAAVDVVDVVDVVESTGTGMVVDLTCNAGDAEHAETVTKAVERAPGVHVRMVSDRDLSFALSTAGVG